MPLKTFVKVSGITNLSDARYFAALEADWLTYYCNILSKAYIPPEKVIELKNWISGPKHCGECISMTLEEIQTAIKECELDGIEVDQFFSGKSELPDNIIVFTRIIIGKETSFEELAGIIQEISTGTHHFILDFKANGIRFSDLKNNTPFQLTDLESLCQAASIIIDIDLVGSEVEEFLKSTKTKGLNLHGGEEEKVGIRSFDDVRDIMEVLEEWE